MGMVEYGTKGRIAGESENMSSDKMYGHSLETIDNEHVAYISNTC